MLLNLIWDVREGWGERIAAEREQARQELVTLLDQIGETFDQLAIRDTFLDGLGHLVECGGHTGGLSFAAPASDLAYCRQRREDLIAAALAAHPGDLGYRLPAEVAEALADLARHLTPPGVGAEYEIAAW